MRIFEYAITGVVGNKVVDMPTGARVFGVRAEAGDNRLLAIVNPAAPLVPRKFVSYAMGNPIPATQVLGKYLGTTNSGIPIPVYIFEDLTP